MRQILKKSAAIFMLSASLTALAGCDQDSASSKNSAGPATVLLSEATTGPSAEDSNQKDLWFQAGQKALKARIETKINDKKAKNVILFIGDGMGVSTLTAGRIFEGQQNALAGEESLLSFERFPFTALVKTYNSDAQVADSAGTASALNTGVKTRIGVINTAPDILQNHCPTDASGKLAPLAAYAEQAGLKTGIVSTARLTHATPAAVYASSPNRDWERETSPEAAAAGCRDIASQITNSLGGDGLDVALGGGRENFLPQSDSPYGQGKRTDHHDIVADWLKRPESHYVQNKAELDALDLNNSGPVLGLFANSHMAYSLDAPKDTPEGEPSLSDMTESAIKLLSKGDKGFYLMVEAGRIDHAHHVGNAARALSETAELSKAVRRALELVDMEETLILVTADHSHVFTMAGYAERGNPILGLVRPAGGERRKDEGEFTLAKDGKPYTTLGYQNGPGAVFNADGSRAALNETETSAPDFRQQALVPLSYETHGGEDVALFAAGPKAHLVHGTMEQNVIFHIMRHALGLDASELSANSPEKAAKQP